MEFRIQKSEEKKETGVSGGLFIVTSDSWLLTTDYFLGGFN